MSPPSITHVYINATGAVVNIKHGRGSCRFENTGDPRPAEDWLPPPDRTVVAPLASRPTPSSQLLLNPPPVAPLRITPPRPHPPFTIALSATTIAELLKTLIAASPNVQWAPILDRGLTVVYEDGGKPDGRPMEVVLKGDKGVRWWRAKGWAGDWNV